MAAYGAYGGPCVLLHAAPKEGSVIAERAEMWILCAGRLFDIKMAVALLGSMTGEMSGGLIDIYFISTVLKSRPWSSLTHSKLQLSRVNCRDLQPTYTAPPIDSGKEHTYIREKASPQPHVLQYLYIIET